MALSTVTILDTMAWCRQFTYNRNFGIGNSLEPAITSAQMILDTILSPPFTFWWNSLELSFTCSTAFPTSPITSVTVLNGTVTLNTVNNWIVGNQVLVSGLVGASFLNGQLLTVQTETDTTITAQYNGTNYGPTADTGTLTAITTQDYVVNVPNFSHIEHASLLDITKTPNVWKELTVKNNLALDSTLARPDFISPEVEDANGNVSFRMMPSPSSNYPIALHVQKSAPLITSLNQTWAPIPDYMQYVYNWGFLALMWNFSSDPRAPFANQKFTSALLGRAQGLSQEARNIFLDVWNMQSASDAMEQQQGVQARSV